MNVLWLGLPLWTADSGMGEYGSTRGHAMRTLAAEGEADYQFDAGETTAQVLERIAADWPVDLLLCWHPELFPPPLEVEHSPAPTVAVVSDWNIYSAQLISNLCRYDLALSDRPGAEQLRLRHARTEYVFPLYSHCSRAHRRMDIERDIDVLFAGNLNHAIHVQRGRLLEQVASLSDRHTVRICEGVFGDEYTRLLNRARIVFNHSVRGEMNLRCFEALACGALLFLEEENREASDYLRDREDVVLYRADNLTELLEYYLDRPGEAEAIAARGHAKSASLALENRLDDLFDRLAGVRAGARGFHNLPEEEKGLAFLLQYASSLVPSQQAVVRPEAARLLQRFPDRAEFEAAAGLWALQAMGDAPESERRRAAQEALGRLKKACALRPDVAGFWLNLAKVCESTTAQETVAQVLARALEAGSDDFGGLVMGSVADPYYVAWRRALATGTARVEILWADAAARLAEHSLRRGDFQAARKFAAQSMGWLPGIAYPYRLKARAETALNHPAEAAALLEDCLPLSAFDVDLRTELIRLMKTLGRLPEARELAEESARMFDACPGGIARARQFRAMA